MDDIRNIEESSIDESITKSIRPQNIDDFVGQAKLLENLRIFISSAKKRNVQMDHCLLYGPPGLGKTTLANIIAKEMNVNIRITSGPMLMKTGDLAAILTNLKDGDVLFIDEIHRMPIAVEEVLYSAMEDYRLDIIIGSGPSAKTVKIDLNKFNRLINLDPSLLSQKDNMIIVRVDKKKIDSFDKNYGFFVNSEFIENGDYIDYYVDEFQAI